MIEQFRNLKSDIPDNQQLALKLNEVICALDAIESGQPDVQQLKPKMPSFEMLWDEVGLFECDRAVCQRFYMCIARHFGH
jgi:hypothetical protein